LTHAPELPVISCLGTIIPNHNNEPSEAVRNSHSSPALNWGPTNIGQTHCIVSYIKVKKSQYSPGQALRVPGIEAPRF